MVAMPVLAAMEAMALMALQVHPTAGQEGTEVTLASQVWVVADPRLAVMVWPPIAAAMAVTAV
jgi:hypothetical protein